VRREEKNRHEKNRHERWSEVERGGMRRSEED